MFLSVVLQFSKSFQKQLAGFGVLSTFFFFLTDIWHENSCEVGIFESKEREVQ